MNLSLTVLIIYFTLLFLIPLTLINRKGYLKSGESISNIDSESIDILGLHFSEESLKLLPFLVSFPKVVNNLDCADNKIQGDQFFLIVYGNPGSPGLE